MKIITFSCLLIFIGCNQPTTGPFKGADKTPSAASTSTPRGRTGFYFNQIRVLYRPPAPPYPPVAKACRIQGIVVVELGIDTHGIPCSALALSGPIQLRPTAVAYALKWKFSPALLNGVPQYALFKMTIPFLL